MVRFNKTHMTSQRSEAYWRTLHAAGLAILLCSPMFAIDRDLRIEQLYHTSWTHKQGAPSEIMALAQTTDGFLWIGTRTGLYRFDGLRFELYQPADGQLPTNVEVDSLLAVPDGGLWIGYDIAPPTFLKEGKTAIYPQDQGSPGTDELARDSQGVIWRAVGPQGLYRFAGSRWETVGAKWGFSGAAYKLYVDRAGTLWVDTFQGLICLPRGAGKFQRPTNFRSAWAPLAESPGGDLWMLEWSPPSAPQVRPAGPGPALRKFDKRARVTRMIFDRQGSLWVGTAGYGINRTQYPEHEDGTDSGAPDLFRQSDGLSGDIVVALMEDREGDVWAATNGGLDRFRQSPLITVAFPADALGFSLSPRENGRIWVNLLLGKDDFVEIRDGKAVALKPIAPVHGAYRDRDGTTWLGTEAGILHFAGNKVEKIDSPAPTGKAGEGFAYSIARDGAGRLLALFNITGKPLKRLENGRWTDLADLGIDSHGLRTLTADSAGVVWLAYSNDKVVRLEEEKVSSFTGKDGIAVGHIVAIGSRKDGLWIGGDRGIQRFDGHRFVTVGAADGSAFHNVLGMIATTSNGIWLGEARGIVHIAEAEIRRVEQNPGYLVQYQVFDVLDGLSDGLQTNYPAPNMVEGTDGRLWFSTAQGVVWLDPKRVAGKPPARAAAILSMTANGHEFRLPAAAKLILPPHTSNLQFIYTAPGLAIPERVRFRYKLEGQDKDWRDAGAHREADYTNLGPGDYRFRVAAGNADGEWNEAGTAAEFFIQPGFFQTPWFVALCVCAGLIVVWQLYCLRLRQLSAQMQVRLEERVSERTRLARDLHDTLLQSFQGMVLRLRAVDCLLPEGKAKDQLGQTLQRADQAIAEGRSAVYDLRSSTMVANDLAQAIQAVGDELAAPDSAAFHLVVEGPVKDLHPIIRDELYRITREALRNAFSHAHAHHIETEITYGERVLRLRVRDDGEGILPEILEAGRPGHYGLAGMRERAKQIGGKLDIWSGAGKGTEMELSIAGSIAYATSPGRHLLRLFRKNGG